MLVNVRLPVSYSTVQWEMRVALWGYKQRRKDSGEQQRIQNSTSETFNTRLVWCEFMWAFIKLWVFGGWQAGNCLRSPGNVSERGGAAGLLLTAAFCPLSCLHPEARPFPQASSQKVNNHRAVCLIAGVPPWTLQCRHFVVCALIWAEEPTNNGVLCQLAVPWWLTAVSLVHQRWCSRSNRTSGCFGFKIKAELPGSKLKN